MKANCQAISKHIGSLLRCLTKRLIDADKNSHYPRNAKNVVIMSNSLLTWNGEIMRHILWLI